MYSAREVIIMASGAILGLCPVCFEYIWEAEDYIVTESLAHTSCLIAIEDVELRFLLLQIPRARQLRLLQFLDGITGTHK